MRFCSSCGLPLNVIAEVLASGGQLHWRPPEPSAPRPLSPRQKGVRQGVMMMLSVVFVMPIVIFLGVRLIGFPKEVIPLVGSILVMGGFLRILYATLFQEGAPDAQPAAMPYAPPTAQPFLNAPTTQNAALPPTPETPPYFARSPQRYHTGELPRRPPSVTESTTRLLDRDQPEEPRRG